MSTLIFVQKLYIRLATFANAVKFSRVEHALKFMLFKTAGTFWRISLTFIKTRLLLPENKFVRFLHDFYNVHPFLAFCIQEKVYTAKDCLKILKVTMLKLMNNAEFFCKIIWHVRNNVARIFRENLPSICMLHFKMPEWVLAVIICTVLLQNNNRESFSRREKFGWMHFLSWMLWLCWWVLALACALWAFFRSAGI